VKVEEEQIVAGRLVDAELPVEVDGSPTMMVEEDRAADL
jgi:hypothetical protein